MVVADPFTGIFTRLTLKRRERMERVRFRRFNRLKNGRDLAMSFVERLTTA
jgi:hypothetical protein